MLKLMKNSCLFLLATGLLSLNAQQLQTKEVPVLDQPKKVQEQPMVVHNLEPQQEVLQPVKTDPTQDPVAQSDAHKLEAAKQRLDVAANVQKIVTTQETLESTIASLATQMMQNKKMHTTKPVLITTFVRLDNLKKTSEFGRVLSESLINELSNRGFNVIEFRGQVGVSINEQGEYFITRDTNKLKDTIENTYVVVGTYSRQYKNIMLNARVIDNISGQIISTSRATFAHNLRDDCVIFKDCQPPRSIKIVKE
ncbi:MAG: FlgO family outer membrane protein [Sulfurimonadaceae bacterium]|jgi:TolB-like protein|nr:FlgO family outer membrane protein [Arcobacteraceae bacterium]MDX9795402.1 FlgO family outer membrane protein [Arcobacteraceae bacterium]